MSSDFSWKNHADYDFDQEYDDDDVIQIGGYFHDKECGYHMEHGVRVHRTPFGSLFHQNNDHNKKTSAIFDLSAGTITDVFYGNCTDFNQWFVGKIARNERFYIVGYIDGVEPIQVHQAPGLVGENYMKFRCNKLGQWRVATA